MMADAFDEAVKGTSVSARLLRAISHVESRGDPSATNAETGAQGQMQIMPDTAKRFGVDDAYDPKQALPAAAKILDENLKRYGSEEKAVLAYHGGTDQSAWGPKTKKYLSDVAAEVNKNGGHMLSEVAGAADTLDLDQKIAAAKKEGYSDKEIYDHLSSDPVYGATIKAAKDQGYADADIFHYLGLKAPEGAQQPGTPAAGASSPASAPGPDNKYNFQVHKSEDESDAPVPLANPDILRTMNSLHEAGAYDPQQIPGSVHYPLVQMNPNSPIPPDRYVVDYKGNLHVPKDPSKAPAKDEFEAAARGAVQGTDDVVTHTLTPLGALLSGGMPAAQAAAGQAQTREKAYTADPTSKTVFAQGGRFGAQQAAELPAILATGGAGELASGAATAAEAGAALKGASLGTRLLGKTAPILRFATGAAGEAPAAGELPLSTLGAAGNRLVRMGSRATAGGILGAEQASMQGDDPVTGAVAGALVPGVAEAAHGLGTATGEAVGNILKPLTDSGRNQLVDDFIRRQAAGGNTILSPSRIAGINLTAAEQSGNPGIAGLERTVRDLRPNTFNLANSRAPVYQSALLNLTGSDADLEAARDARAAATGPLRDDALAQFKLENNRLTSDAKATADQQTAAAQAKANVDANAPDPTATETLPQTAAAAQVQPSAPAPEVVAPQAGAEASATDGSQPLLGAANESNGRASFTPEQTDKFGDFLTNLGKTVAVPGREGRAAAYNDISGHFNNAFGDLSTAERAHATDALDDFMDDRAERQMSKDYVEKGELPFAGGDGPHMRLADTWGDLTDDLRFRGHEDIGALRALRFSRALGDHLNETGQTPEEFGQEFKDWAKKNIPAAAETPPVKEAPTPGNLDDHPLADKIAEVDKNLPRPAQVGISDFVGHPPGSAAENYARGASGRMDARSLEDAYDPNPSPGGQMIRDSLDKATQPVRDALREQHGDNVRLFRVQRPVAEDNPDILNLSKGNGPSRNVLSWTSDPDFAKFHAGVRPDLKPYTDDEIQALTDEYQKNGRVSIPRSQQSIVNEDGQHWIHDPRVGGAVTDVDSVEQFLRGKNETIADHNATMADRAKRIISADVPVDDVLHVTHRAGQSEFVLRNRPGSPQYINDKGIHEPGGMAETAPGEPDEATQHAQAEAWAQRLLDPKGAAKADNAKAAADAEAWGKSLLGVDKDAPALPTAANDAPELHTSSVPAGPVQPPKVPPVAPEPLVPGSQKGAPVDTHAVVKVIDNMLAGESGQRDAVADSLRSVREKLVKPDGTYQDNPELLYGVRKHIGDLMDGKVNPGNGRSDARAAARELTSVKSALDNEIDRVVPGFSDYLSKYADMSKPVNQMEFLQKLNLTNGHDVPTLAKVDAAIKGITILKNKGGVNGATSITDAQMKFLNDLKDTLQKQDNVNLGRSVGSNTVQNLATHNLLSGLSIPGAVAATTVGHNPVGGALLGGMKLLYGSQNSKILDILADRLANPQPGMLAPKAPPPGQGNDFVRNLLVRGVGPHIAIPAFGHAANSLVNPGN